ncbi:MAG TPA: FlgD immunoglobulin-like domain containing protein [Candidatus Krumholzibacteria bacterium]|nr:FlgD immunoglobulin-like domain containing protein [Candidatus Krumholzibacteria bacterium]HPD72483.1 FlgD immunoglobulin-like domain containing protein [Candidatus Krumholzibacteria bacterium]HRY40585.1 FlgD immunoglobulin-like domain containing protein [Candidatus Krumholzibacteria bacterium]
MRARLLQFCVALTALTATAGADPVLQTVGTIVTPAAVDWAPWGVHTVAVTGLDARLVRWPVVEPDRAQILFDLPAGPSGLEAWSDSVLIRIPPLECRLLENAGGDAASYTIKPANWHLPNVTIAGVRYRIFVDPEFYLLVYTAPGPGGILGLLDFEETIGHCDHWAFASDRAALSNADGVHIVNLESPQLPVIQATIDPPVPGWIAADLAMRDRVLFLRWGDRIQTWDLELPHLPVLLDEIASDADQLALGSRWLATWRDQDLLVTVLAAADPAALAIRGSFTARALLDPDDVRVHGDRILVRSGDDLSSWTIPAGSSPIAGAGDAWPVLAGGLLATAGPAAWLQDAGRRYVISLGYETVTALQRGAGAAGGLCSLEADHGTLYYNDESAGVSIESLADPYEPVVLAVLDPDPPVIAADPAGDLLATTDANGLVLYDVSDPAAPAPVGALALDGAPRRVLVIDQTAIVAADLASASSLVHVVDLADPAAPVLVATFSLAYDANGPWWGGPMVRRGDQALIMAWRPGATARLVAATLVVSLADPAHPQASFGDVTADFWCFTPGVDEDLAVVVDDLPAELVGCHVSYRGAEVNVYRYAGDPAALDLLVTWTAPGAVHELAAAGNRLLVLTAQRLDVLTLSDPIQVAVPAAPAAAAVRAVPNPFNPLTAITLALRRAGAVTVDILDARGGRVRTLRTTATAGEARLEWDGTDDAGRALPSGTYLLRLSTPDGPRTARCTLVR